MPDWTRRWFDMRVRIADLHDPLEGALVQQLKLIKGWAQVEIDAVPQAVHVAHTPFQPQRGAVRE